jgi:hypothetical protein
LTKEHCDIDRNASDGDQGYDENNKDSIDVFENKGINCQMI